jgi:hypothetical protein
MGPAIRSVLSSSSNTSCHAIQQVKISLPAHVRSSHIRPNVCHRHAFWTAFYNERSFHPVIII